MEKKHRKLMDFAKKPARGEAQGGEGVGVSESHEAPVGLELASQRRSIIEEVLEILQQRQKYTQTTPSNIQTPMERGVLEGRAEEEAVERRELPLFNLDKLLETASKAYERGGINIIYCDKSGVCSDNRRLGEVYEDSSGLKWQRTFIHTTRLPIFLDFIAEEADLRGRIGKAFIVVTSRNAKAIIPDEYICEAISRYGLLLNIDKCTNYKPSPWAERKKRQK